MNTVAPVPVPAVAYLRASDDSQKLTPEAQRVALTAYASAHGMEVVAWHLDFDVSSVAAVEDRPGLLEAIAAVATGQAKVLLVAKRDRLARDVLLAGAITRQVERLGGRVESAAGEGNGTTPADEFMRTVIDGAAQYERALIRARTKAALAVLRSHGVRTSSKLPYGFSLAADGRHLVACEVERALARQAASLRAAGASLPRISSELGRNPRTGNPFSTSQVLRLLAAAASNAATTAA